jgi:hypothetical protein
VAWFSRPSPDTDPPGQVIDPQYEQLGVGFAGDGLLGSPSDPGIAYADSSGRQIKIRANCVGLLRGHLFGTGDADTTISVGANTSGSTRIDLLVARLDRTTWDVTPVLKPGTPGSGAPSTQRDGFTASTGKYEIPLLEVTAVNGASTIAPADVKLRAWYLRPDGGIACASGTQLPPHYPGLQVYRVDTGLSYVSDGTTWNRLPTFAASPKYIKSDTATATTDNQGFITIAHNLGVVPDAIHPTMLSAAFGPNVGHTARVIDGSVTATSFKARVLDGAGGVIDTLPVKVMWTAIKQ